MLQCINRDHNPTLPFGQSIPVTRTVRSMTAPRHSLFQASATARFIAAGLLTVFVWAAILWAGQ